MVPYSKYKDLMERNYVMGESDCFGLLRDFYVNCYGIKLPNFARPKHFFDPRINVYARIVAQPEFQERGLCVTDFKEGDLIAFRVMGADLVNHVGVYLGNNLFLHQMFDGVPREENLDERWLRRIYMVHYHVDVPIVKKKLDPIDILPDYLKAENYVEQ